MILCDNGSPLQSQVRYPLMSCTLSCKSLHEFKESAFLRKLSTQYYFIACLIMQKSDIVFPSPSMDHIGIKKALLDSGNKSCFLKKPLQLHLLLW